MEKLFEQECLLCRIDLMGCGMRAASEKAGQKMTRHLIAGCRIIINLKYFCENGICSF